MAPFYLILRLYVYELHHNEAIAPGWQILALFWLQFRKVPKIVYLTTRSVNLGLNTRSPYSFCVFLIFRENNKWQTWMDMFSRTKPLDSRVSICFRDVMHTRGADALKSGGRQLNSNFR